MEESVLNAALAGLLHDIGKIEQRALTVPRKSAPGYEDEGQPAHATYSAYFIQTNVPQKYHAAALAGTYHHAPDRSKGADKRLSKLIALADKLSAGERADDVSKASRPPRQMMTIFDRISLAKTHKEKEEKDRRYLPLRPLMLSRETLFPVERQDKDSEGDGYQGLVDALAAAAKTDPGDMLAYIENMLGALQTSAWCVPSAYYYNAPDVSLYDHSRMTAALAVCMAEYPESEIDILLESAREAFKDKDRKPLPDTPIALLIGGDVSGIQKFIYTITSKKAAQTLRGRSFYLQLLTEAVLRFVLNELGLPYTNVIYSGGGHFFLLAPVNAKEKVDALRSEITRKMLVHHGTSLYFALGFSEVPASGFAAGKFPEYWDKMHAHLAEAKSCRYTELGDEIHSKVFAVLGEGGNPDDTCSVCGGDALAIKENFEDYDASNSRICSMCDSFSAKLGKVLPEAKFVALGWRKPDDAKPATFEEALASFGLQIQILKTEQSQIALKDAERVSVWALDDSGNGYPKTNLPVTHMLRYTVNEIPVSEKGEIITFDEMQEMVGDGKGGFKRLGVLRMDVDNLGDVFKSGLGRYATLARISTLSFQMSLFFEGWVKRICDMPEFKGRIYAVYAGGDDVFLIGPWDVMPNLALQIRADFADYTANHPDLHVSAGLAFIGGKYPIYQAAEDAEHAVNAAKRKNGKDFKNAFHFIGNTWKWSEFEEVKSKFKRVVDAVEKLNAPHALIQTLRDLAEMKAQKSKNGKEVWGAWQWRGAYLLKRMEERAKGNPALAEAIIAISQDLEPNYANLNQWGAAARWAQLQTRSGQEKQTKNKGE